jgi:lipopolysaccharide/colanic/teichoic acid biosynthesis glycosyltransferase
MSNRPIAKYFLVIFLITITIGSLFSAKSLLVNTHYYPYVDVTLHENVRIKILLNDQVLPTQCSRTLASQLTAITNICPNCRIQSSACLTNIDSTQKRWLRDEALTTPSARMTYGVAIFQSSQPELALAACQKIEGMSLNNPISSSIKCFPAGTKRPLLNAELDLISEDHSDQVKSFVFDIASIVCLIALFVAAFSLLRRYAVREPTDNNSSETNSDVIVALKLSNILKRILDKLLAIALLITLLPVLLLAALLIRILEGAPIFYISHRFISSEDSVSIYKFRTMVKDATSPKYQLNERFMRDGFLDIPLDCEVYTPIGRLLERTQIVEVLQLLNILFDGMSFVGNRPLPKNNIELLKKFPGWNERFYSPTGITGISQIVGKYGLMPHQRLHLERMYSNIYTNPNGNILLCDFYIIFYTALLVLTGHYLDYNKGIALLIRCGADKDLPTYFPTELECNDQDNP